jgi:hypothetical protein
VLFDDLGVTPLFILLGAGAILVWIVGALGRPGPSRSIPRAIVGLTILLGAAGWASYLGRRGTAGGGGSGAVLHVGLMIGLAVAATASRMGAALEERRFEVRGGGTPRSAMAKRATLFFLLLTVVALAERGAGLPEAGLGWTVVACLSILWVPAAVAWWASPQAGPLGREGSIAARSTFFGLAVGGLVSLGSPWLTGSPLARGLWLGVELAVGLLVAVAWVATAARPRTAVLLVALSASVVGLALRGSL